MECVLPFTRVFAEFARYDGGEETGKIADPFFFDLIPFFRGQMGGHFDQEGGYGPCPDVPYLHDRVGQNLAALNLNLNILRSQLSSEALQVIGTRLDDSVSLVNQILTITRNVMADLRVRLLISFVFIAIAAFSVFSLSAHQQREEKLWTALEARVVAAPTESYPR